MQSMPKTSTPLSVREPWDRQYLWHITFSDVWKPRVRFNYFKCGSIKRASACSVDRALTGATEQGSDRSNELYRAVDRSSGRGITQTSECLFQSPSVRGSDRTRERSFELAIELTIDRAVARPSERLSDPELSNDWESKWSTDRTIVRTNDRTTETSIVQADDDLNVVSGDCLTRHK